MESTSQVAAVLAAAALVLGGGLFSGLTLGVMSIEPMKLNVRNLNLFRGPLWTLDVGTMYICNLTFSDTSKTFLKRVHCIFILHQILLRSGTDEEKKQAAILQPLLEQHHLLLVALLMSNAFAMEALPEVLDGLMSPAAAVLTSVTAVLIFGEVLPQVCSAPLHCAVLYLSVPLCSSTYVR